MLANNVTGLYLFQVSLLLIGQQGLEQFFKYCANFMPTPRRKTTNAAPTTLGAIQAACQFTLHNYTPLMISWNVKNKLLTLLSQRKLALTARNTLFALRVKIIGTPKKCKNWPCPLFRPKTNHTCHRKPNPFRETAP